MVEVQINYNKVSVGKKRTNLLRRYGVVGRTICAKKVHRGDPEGAIGRSKKTLRRSNIN